MSDSKENKKGSDVITIDKGSLWKYATIALFAVILIGAVVMLTGNKNDNGGNGGGGSTVEVSIDDDAVLGEKNAPVTIIEFSDYQCPFCRKFWTETLPSLKSEYIDTGKVKLVYRDAPLSSLHPMAQVSAEAVECARDAAGTDEAYYKMHDKIYGEQNIIDSGSINGPVAGTAAYTTDDLKSWASEIGYNIDSCLSSGKFKSEVQKDLKDGNDASIAAGNQGIGTPFFVINGVPLSGAYPIDSFRQIIDSAL